MRKIERGLTDPAPLFRHGDRAGSEAPGLLDFCVTLNPLGPPPAVLHTLSGGRRAVARYPDPGCRELVERLAEWHGCPPEQVVVGNGANDLIYLVTRAARPSRVAIAEPTYTEYLRAALVAGAEVTHWLAAGDDFRPAPFDPEGAELLWLCNPNNPTGQLWPADLLAGWIHAHPRTLFAVDEAFLPLTFPGEPDGVSLIPWTSRLPNLVVLRSLTKLYALPGLRLGYAVASPEWAHRLRAQAVPWSVNALAQLAGVAALADDAYQRSTRAWLDSEARSFAGRLAEVDARFRPLPSATSFVLVRLEGLTAGRVVARLRQRGMAVRDASNFVGLDGRCVRIAARGPEDNTRLLEALAVL
ncbi:MAG: threonine-phosphate decarboxylase CobD [Gemmataceae bacterium]|nr:threonine-phosphate decarboxylase CobD [Gemmataceae bacterium]